MSDEDKILQLADGMAEAATSMHFHNHGLMNDQVDPLLWGSYIDKVRNAILETISMYSF